MLAMKEINERLRVMLGIDPIKQEDIINGQGGEETPIPTDGTRSEGEGGGVPGGDHGASMPERRVSGVEPQVWDKALVLQVQNDLSKLQTEAVSQERSLEELSEVANQKSARWASMPSVWPVKGWITSGFGPRVSPFTGQPAMHEGLDIGAAPNAPVQAPAAARVSAMGFDSKMGNMVRLDHGYGFETQYAHLAKILVKNGQRVKRGDIIGLVGSTGLSTGPHLHYLVKVNNQAVNPRHYILN
jgi:murein DD-endopeptidase MepM/ murein hydrolase activator NlpD